MENKKTPKKQGDTKTSGNTKQTGTSSAKVHEKNQQQSNPNKQDTNRGLAMEKGIAVNDDASNSSSQPNNFRNEDCEYMETNQTDTDQPYALEGEATFTTKDKKIQKKQGDTKTSRNTKQTGTSTAKGHGKNQQQSNPNKQDTNRGLDMQKGMFENNDASGSSCYLPNDKKETAYEVMDTSPTGAVPPHDLQEQMQLQRSIEASKQMLYGVFGNVITILEEYEKREMAKHQLQQQMPKSKVHIPEQSHKSFEDVKSIVETQLLLFETQTKVCPKEAKSEILEDLKRRTISWSAVREEMGISGVHETDFYVTKLYEILATGKTDHSHLKKQEVSKEGMREGFQAFLQGDHDRETLDKEFKTNKDKKASAPGTRESEMLADGAKRISRARGNQDLDKFLENDVKMFEDQGPNNIR